MLIWTLIIILMGGGSSTSYAIDHIPFHTQDACEHVKKQIELEIPKYTTFYKMCRIRQMMTLEKTHFLTIYNAFGYSPGGRYIERDNKIFLVVSEKGKYAVDRKTVKKLNKLHPCFGVQRIVYR
jgi:hypothetical protein